MTPDDARTVILKRIRPTMADSPVGVPHNRITADNEPFDEAKLPDDAQWIRVVVRHSGRNQTTLGRPGNRKFQSDATLIAQVFVPNQKRTDIADRLAKSVADLFDSSTLDGLNFQAATIREGGSVRQARWFMMIVEVPFYYFDRK